MRISDWSSDVCSSDLLRDDPPTTFRDRMRVFRSLFRSVFASRRTPTPWSAPVPPPSARFRRGLPQQCCGHRPTFQQRSGAMKPTTRPALDGHLTDRDTRILIALEQFRLLTTRHLQRLNFAAEPLGPHTSTSSATRATTRVLGRLEQLGAITRLDRRIGGIKHGSALTLWQVASAGDRSLRTRRGDPIRRRYEEPGLVFTEHQLAVAEVATTVIEQAQAQRFDLLELEAEPNCWRTFTGPANTVITLKPDLLIVAADASTETHSYVEVDRGTEHLPAVLRKCRTYQRSIGRAHV